MADTPLTKAQNIAACADNTARGISEGDLRNVVESIVPAMGGLYISGSSATTVSDTTSYFKVAGTTTSRTLHNFTMDTDGRLTYSGTPDIHVDCTATISMTAAQNNENIHFRVGLNGDATTADAIASETERYVSTGADVGAASVHYDSQMSNGDYLELFVRNETSATNVTVTRLKLFVRGFMSVA